MLQTSDLEKVERLIKLSETKPLIPDEFVPWHVEEDEDVQFMPEHLISLQGHELYDSLSSEQKRELGRMELGQVMYSYGWSEGLACVIFNKRLIKLNPETHEYRYLVNELIEEFRHQDMFAKAVRKVNVNTYKASRIHRMVGWIQLNLMPVSVMFISVLSVELMTDIYGKMIRRDPKVFEPIRKVSELHHIEEGRHVQYTKMWLKHYLDNSNFLLRTLYSIVVMWGVLFMRTLYVREEIFEKLGVDSPKKYTKAAKENLKKKMGEQCLPDVISFVKSFDGFNFITRPIWKSVLNAKI